MQTEFDPAKDALNRAKHGLSLGEAAKLDWPRAETSRDMRQDYGEPRWIALGVLAGRTHVVVYTPRNGVMRVISLRRANRREARRYGRLRAARDRPDGL